jgi:hypothetical protein
MLEQYFQAENTFSNAYSKDSIGFLNQSIAKKIRRDCPLCGGDNTLSATKGYKQDFVAKCFSAKCTATGPELLAAIGIGPTRSSPYQPLPSIRKSPSDIPERRRERIEQVLKECRPIMKGTPPWLYLDRRGCLPNEQEGIPPCLLYHPCLPYYDNGKLLSHNPSMVAKLENIHHDLVNIQRFYLTHDGRKAYGKSSKKLMTTPIEGASKHAAIQLDEPGCMTLAIAEGLETALWLRKRSKWPFWACYSADAMREIQIPHGIQDVLIFPDSKPQERRAAMSGAMRLIGEGFKVKVMPPPSGKDWDDQAIEDGDHE